jgi:hypothetical protein
LWNSSLIPVEQSPAAVHRSDRVVEAGGFGVRADRIDLGAVLLQRLVERGLEVLGTNLLERGQTVGRVPGLQQRVAHGKAHRRCLR